MIQPWKELSREQVFKKYSRRIDKVMFELPDGSQTDFYLLDEGAASATVGLTADNEIILVAQYRPGPAKILHELPGGFIDPGEDPAASARREFLEETGYDGEFELVGTCLDSAYSNMERYCFVAKNCHKVQEPEHTSTEQPELVLTSLEKFRELLRSGQMTDVEIGYLGLDYLNLL
jgi:ADP-ribose pyrophosphatase